MIDNNIITKQQELIKDQKLKIENLERINSRLVKQLVLFLNYKDSFLNLFTRIDENLKDLKQSE